MSQMKAVRIHSYGDASVLRYEDAPRPELSEGQALIRVHATTVNPFDCAVRAGYMASYFNYTLPLILGTDIAGVVEEVGPGANSFKPDDEVYGRGGVTGDGAYAQYVALPVSDMALKPPSLDFDHAAALPHVILTAWESLIVQANLSSGQRVLIHGAAGGVGHVAVQLAKSRGATVIGTTSRHFDYLKEIGVDQVIDYTAMPFEDAVEPVDVVLDLVGGDTQERSWQVLKPGGMLVSAVQAPSAEEAANWGVQQAMCFATPPIGETLTEVAAMVKDGSLEPHVSTVLPLEEAATAHQMVEGRHTQGKLVLQVD
jgi:NADPH:quinone reductase-like Zn-dependent oxidoreductase